MAPNKIDKIVNESKKNPIQALILTLLIGISSLAGVVTYLYNKENKVLKSVNTECISEKRELNTEVERLNRVIAQKDSSHKAEILQLMNNYNQELKDQIAKQDRVNDRNQALIHENSNKLNKLQ